MADCPPASGWVILYSCYQLLLFLDLEFWVYGRTGMGLEVIGTRQSEGFRTAQFRRGIGRFHNVVRGMNRGPHSLATDVALGSSKTEVHSWKPTKACGPGVFHYDSGTTVNSGAAAAAAANVLVLCSRI